jgi:lipoate-protein ligase A
MIEIGLNRKDTTHDIDINDYSLYGISDIENKNKILQNKFIRYDSDVEKFKYIENRKKNISKKNFGGIKRYNFYLTPNLFNSRPN